MSSAYDWRAKAACRDKDPELFFPVGNTGAAYQQIEEAKAVCRTCKVIDACLKCALDTNQDYGVWGGLSEDERRALKRRAMRARRSQAMQMQVCELKNRSTDGEGPSANGGRPLSVSARLPRIRHGPRESPVRIRSARRAASCPG